MLFKKKKKQSLWTKKASEMTVLDGIKLSGITMLLGLLPLGIVSIKEAIDDHKEAKKRKAEEQRHLEAIMNGREDSDTTW